MDIVLQNFLHIFGTSGGLWLFKCSKTIRRNNYIFKKKICMSFKKTLFFSVKIFFFQIKLFTQNKYLYPLSKNLNLLKKNSLCKNIRSV